MTSENISLLQELGESGEYLFHGSEANFDTLVPRQQEKLDPVTGKKEPDGQSAVCATEIPEVAVFRALINSRIDRKRGSKHLSGFSTSEGKTTFRATQNSLDWVKNSNAVGYVFLLPKKDFELYQGTEYRAYHEIKPAKVIEVGFKDLPGDIEIIS